MNALIPRVCGPRALGIRIRQIPYAHVTTITYVTIWIPLIRGVKVLHILY